MTNKPQMDSNDMLKNLATLFIGISFILFAQQVMAQKSVLIVKDNHSSKPKMVLISEAAEKVDIKFEYVDSRKLDATTAMDEFKKHDLVLFDGMTAEVAAQFLGQYQPVVQGLVAEKVSTRFASLREVGMPALTQGVSADDAENISRYYTSGGQPNFDNMMAYISTRIFDGSAHFKAPQIIPKMALYHPDFPARASDDADGFFKWLNTGAQQAIIAIAIHRGALEAEQTQIVDALIREAEKQNVKALGFFYEGEDEQKPYTELLMNSAETRIDSIINLRMIHHVDKRRKELTILDVPVIQGMVYRAGDQADFETALAGVSATMTPYFLILPETAGLIDSTIIAATDMKTREQQVIDYQVTSVVRRAVSQARLRHLSNRDKRLATLIWNYPPGEKNIGAAFLNVPESLHRISAALQNAGYKISEQEEQFYIDNAGRLLKPFYREDDLNALIQDGLADYMPLADYETWFKTLPQDVQISIIERWGQAKDNKMVRDHNGEAAFVIPRMTLGNMMIAPQPPRSDTPGDSAALYHSMSTPINHFYLATYLYIREHWKADAIIHLGTHGSQEWLPGKERALANFDPPHLAVGDLPVIYPYIMDNVGEGMQAKRRGRAVTLSHLTPGFARAELYGDFAGFSQLYNDWLSLDQGETRQRTQQQIMALTERLKLNKDIGWSEKQISADTAHYFTQIHDYLHEMAQEAQPLGLHTFGDTPIDVHLVTTLAQMLGEDFIKRAAIYEHDAGLVVDVPEAKQASELDKLDVVSLEQLTGFKVLWQTVIEQRRLDIADDELIAHINRGKDYYREFHSQQEMEHLLAALQGRYIPTGTGGDPIRNPEAIVTGKNLIGFNPARVPTKAAYETGHRLVEETIANYYQRHGEYPDKLAFSLWSLETMRHHGVLEAQVLAAMGMRPTWDERGMVSGTEIIPYAELRRPRVDVTVSATGLYRDAFPSVMLIIAKGITELSALKEQGNRIYHHSQSIKAELIAAGRSEQEAEYLSSVRIFSNASGAYGTGLAATTLASDSWQEDSKLSALYLARMGYVFGPDEKRWSEKVEGVNLYAKNLSGTDAVIFSRSTNLYGMLTRDDPFQYFGGISLAVRNIDGKSPDMIVANLRDTTSTKSESLSRFIAREMHSRTFHPRWIKEMQQEGYSGAVQILDRLNNFWGWQVVDPGSVRDDQWQEFFEVYVQDKYEMNMREWFEQHNAHALAQMVERMLEAARKEYWQASPETLKALTETYIDLAQKHDVYTTNETFKEYVNEQALGFGLAPLTPMADSNQAAMPQPAKETAQSTQVEGQKMEKVQQSQMPENDHYYYFVALILAFFIAGFFYQFGAWPRLSKGSKNI